MEYIKKHKLTAFVILVYIVVIAFAYFIYKLFIGSSGLPVYGDRLDGIENVPITDEQKDAIVAKLSESDFVLKVTKPYLNGKILKVIVTIADEAGLQAAKDISGKVVEVLDNDQRAFYDIEYFIRKEYSCTLEATGKMDEDGNFVGDVEVKFLNDLSKSNFATDYGISGADAVEYNKQQSIDITQDGEFIVYGFTKDKVSESKCSIKIVRKASEEATTATSINTIGVNRDCPSIGYMKAGTGAFVWAKTA
jgi:hypothetical protein